jgi:hypothetical protein
MSKPKGSKLVTCRKGHVNFLLPGDERQCSGESCRRVVRVEKARKTRAARSVKKPVKTAKRRAT